MKSTWSFTLFFYLISTSFLAHAETTAGEMSLEKLLDLPFIEIATGTAIPLEKAPAVATLITADDIKAMGALTILEVLESVPGLHTSYSTNSSTSEANIRGIKTSANPQVLYLLNGNRVSYDLGSGSFFSEFNINVQNIARIEVLRGPGSAVYGADAYAGVINIITKNADDYNGVEVGARGGSHNTKNVWVNYANKFNNDWQMALNVEYMKRGADDSQKIESDLQTVLDGLFATNASLAPGIADYRYESTTYNMHVNNNNWKFGLDGWVQRDVGNGAGIALALDPSASSDYDLSLLTAEYSNKDWVASWVFNAKVSYLRYEEKSHYNIFPANATLPLGTDGNFPPVGGFGGVVTFTDGYIGNPGRVNTIPKLDLVALFDGIENHNLRFNFGAKQEKLKANESKNFGPGVLDDVTLGGPPPATVDATLTNVTGTPFAYTKDTDRTIAYVSVQDIWELDTDWTLTAGVRYDDYSDFGSTTNPRIALVWESTSKLTSKLLYGSAFRAPSFNELNGQNNPVGLGDSSLKPETIDTTELAINYRPLSNLVTNVSFYHFVTEDMIDFTENPDGTKTAKNINSLDGQGLEADANWKINNKWTLLANIALQSTKDKLTNTQVPFVPQTQIYADLRYHLNVNWNINTQINWVSDIDRETGDTRKKINDYTLVDLTIRHISSSKKWQLAASIKNLFDENASDPSAAGEIANDFPLNEKRYFIEISYKL